MNAEKIVNDMVIRLNQHKGKYREIANADNPLDYSWLTKFAAGKMKNPTIKRLESLVKALNLIEGIKAA